MNNRNSDSSIIHHGNPVLAQIAKPMALPITPDTHTLIDELMNIMLEANGVGIAAPQIGYSTQVMIIASRPNLRYPDAPLMEPLAMINPTILWHSKQNVLGWEGCLSVPGLRGEVARADEVKVRFIDIHGSQQESHYRGFVARIIQHEFDHLMGKVFLDRVKSPNAIISEETYFQEVL